MRSREFASPTIILITDRTDLDTQLSEQFGTAKKFIGDDCVVEVESRAKLREYLAGRTSGGVFLRRYINSQKIHSHYQNERI